MKQIRGIIIKKEEQKGEKNGKPWTKYNFTIRDENRKDYKCSTFFAPMAENLPEENKVILEVEEPYNNIKNVIENDYDEKAASMVKDEGPKIENVQNEFTPQDYKSNKPDWDAINKKKDEKEERRQNLIVMQNCVTNANKLIENMGVLGFSEEDRKKLFLTGDPIEVIKNFAKKLYDFVLASR